MVARVQLKLGQKYDEFLLFGIIYVLQDKHDISD